MCKVVVLFIKAFILDVFVAVASLNLKVPNLKEIGDYLQPKPGGIIDYGSGLNSPHSTTQLVDIRLE